MIPEPDWNQSIWLSIESKIGRKLTAEENIWYARTSGMYKEWFGNSMAKWTVEETEWWITNRQHPMFTSGPKKQKEKSIVKCILEMIFGGEDE